MISLPNIIYVKKEEGRIGGDYLRASESPVELSEADSTIMVGEYQLVHEVKLTNKTTSE